MTKSIDRRAALAGLAGAAALAALAPTPSRAQGVTLRMSGPMTPTDQRAVALEQIFAPAVRGFATY